MRALIAVVALAGIAHAGPSGRVTGTVKVTEADGKPAAGADVILYVVGFTEPGSNAIVEVTQRGRKFVPDLVAVTAGDTVTFPNGDPFLHNVFSQSPPRKFDLGSFKKGESKDRQFTTLGVVDVYCNIHPEMAATILVVPNKRHARAGVDGKFVLDAVPAGDWTLFAYTRRASKPASVRVKVPADGETAVELVVVRGAEAEHRNKYGEKYKPAGTYR